MWIDLIARLPLNVDSTANSSKSPSMFTHLYTSLAKKCQMVMTRNVPVCLMLVLNCLLLHCVTCSSFFTSRDASMAMNPMILSPSLGIQRPEAVECA